MMKGFAVDENMSNLTCASGDLSASANSSIRNESSSSTHQQQPTQKKKRNLPGNPGIYIYALILIKIIIVFLYKNFISFCFGTLIIINLGYIYM